MLKLAQCSKNIYVIDEFMIIHFNLALIDWALFSKKLEYPQYNVFINSLCKVCFNGPSGSVGEDLLITALDIKNHFIHNLRLQQ